MSASLDFEEHVKAVLLDELSRDDNFLTETDLNILLTEGVNDDPQPRPTIVGYPTYPLYREIASMLKTWMEEKQCPALMLPKYDLLDEKSYAETRNGMICSITPLLEGLKTLWSLWGKEEIKFRVREVLLLLGRRGILDLLGVRKTFGTKEIWPLARKVLLQSFMEKQTANSALWVGSRALAKHYHRDSSTSWWGGCTGNEEAKNEHALKILTKILDGATWINIHWLPHDVIILEMRQEHGYGARWLADGTMFRGFLEPQMVDGHDVGWKH